MRASIFFSRLTCPALLACDDDPPADAGCPADRRCLPCSADCDGVAECGPGEGAEDFCRDGSAVPWSRCTEASHRMCALEPAADRPAAPPD